MEANILLFIQNNLRTPILNAFFQFVTTLGNGGIIWIVLTLCLLCFKKTRRIGICCALALLLSLLVNNVILKNWVMRARPYTQIQNLNILIRPPADFSFPSGHTASSFAVAAVLGLTCRKYSIPAWILAALIAFSRLYIGVHYPTDVAFGILSGILIALAVVLPLRKKFGFKK